MTYAQYLATNSEDQAVRARRRLNAWLDLWDFEDRADVQGRLQKDDAQFRGAYWELFLNAMFRAAGMRVTRDPLAAHGSEQTPDFLVASGDRVAYVEATSVNKSKLALSQERQYNAIIDGLEEVQRRDYVISLQVTERTSQSPSVRWLRNELTNWLDALPTDALLDRQAPSRVFKQSGWSFMATARPCSPEAPPTPIVMTWQVPQSNVITDGVDLRRAIAGKSSRYGELRHPYIVAVLEDTFMGVDPTWHRTTALFGDDVITIASDGQVTRRLRPPGTWTSVDGFRRHHVSGVLMQGTLQLVQPELELPQLWLHPDAGVSEIPQFPVPIARYPDDAGWAVDLDSRPVLWDGFASLPTAS